jgi:hypothetical protein
LVVHDKVEGGQEFAIITRDGDETQEKLLKSRLMGL